MAFAEYPSIVARTIVIPELAVGLSVTCTEPSEDLNRARNTEVDDLLAQEVQDYFGIPYVNVLTYSRWHQISKIVGSTINNPEFERQMLASYGASDTAERTKFQTWLNESRTVVADHQNALSSRESFSQLVIRKIILDPRAEIKGGGTPFLNYTGEPSVLQSVFADLNQDGVADLELLGWQQITGAIERSVLPITKHAFENLQEYEIGTPGSKPITRRTVRDFIGLCTGAAYFVMSGTAYAAAHQLGGSTSTLALLVAQGGVTSLAFIGVGQVAGLLEGRLMGVAHRNRTTKPAKHSPPKKTSSRSGKTPLAGGPGPR
jgi:hypothetical protein